MNRRGITLIEAIASVLMVAVVVTGIMHMVARAFETAERSRRAIELEAMFKSRLDVVALMTENDFLSLPDTLQQGVFEWPLDEYAWRMEVEPSADDIGVYQLRLEITWPPNHRATVESAAYRRPAITTVQ